MTTKNRELLKHPPGVRAHLRIYINNAETRGIKFSLGVSEALKLFGEDCHYCGKAPEERRFATHNKKPYSVMLNGIDRKDPKEGYTVLNTVACCKACNRGKNQLGYDEFLNMARSVAKRHP